MPTGLKAVIAFNIIAATLIWVFAYGYGGGFTGGIIIPADRAAPMALERINAVPTSPEKSDPPPSGVRMEGAGRDAPGMSSGPDVPAPWTILPDGSVRFRDSDR